MCAAMFESQGSLLGRIHYFMEEQGIPPERIHMVFDTQELG